MTSRDGKFTAHRRGRLVRALTRPPFDGDRVDKGWFTHISRGQEPILRQITILIDGWPVWERPLRVAFLSDFHTGSHADDIARLRGVIDCVNLLRPDLALFGGDYVNLQPFGGGRIPPKNIAAQLAQLNAPLGHFAVLGNHDYIYSQTAVTRSLLDYKITVLDHTRHTLHFCGDPIDLVGIPDGDFQRLAGHTLMRALQDQPTIILAHDPVWFTEVPAGPFMMIAGHTHGGQIRLPLLGPLRNGSKAPLRWTYGMICEQGKRLYVTSGIGTSAIPLRWRMPAEAILFAINGTSTKL